MSETDASGGFTIDPCDDCLDPADAFAVVGNETRLSILEALWEAPERPVTFSDLRRRVGIRDSAQFNYHLDKLAGTFVAKTEAGYDFRHAGEKVITAVISGTFTDHPTVAPFPVEGHCTACGGDLQAWYADERLGIECGDCGRTHAHYPFPPGGLEGRSRSELLDAFNQRVRHLHCLAADGVCPECGGRARTTITRESTRLDFEVCVEHRCERCDHRVSSPVGLALLDQSDVVSFHKAHGVDLCGTPYWRFDWCTSDDRTTVLDDDPWRVRVDIPLDDEELRVTLGGDLDVVDVARRTRP
jgi:hypothetical protein